MFANIKQQYFIVSKNLALKHSVDIKSSLSVRDNASSRGLNRAKIIYMEKNLISSIFFTFISRWIRRYLIYFLRFRVFS